MDSFYGFMAKSYDRGLMRLPNETLPEHKAIIAAVKARDAVLACELMISHHLQSRDRLKSLASRGQ
jgi:DNA-binding GntR family transcriptional regulator